MAHYAELNENNEVIYVAYLDNELITDKNGNEVEQLGIDHLHLHQGSDRRWIRTSYRNNFRGKYAGIGYIYREDLDLFTLPQPYPSWTLNTSTAEWEPPIPKPQLTVEQMQNSKFFAWSEEDYNLNDNGWILTTYEELTE